MKNFFNKVWNYFDVFIIAIIVVLPIRYFVVQPFLVRGESMFPTFNNLDYLFIEKISYYFSSFKRGDVIVFRSPINESEFFIKRIIGLPGEKIEIKKGKIIIIKDDKNIEIEEPYINDLLNKNLEATINDNEYFVLGDNRNKSFDSEEWGNLKKNKIIGKVWIRVWPFRSINKG